MTSRFKSSDGCAWSTVPVLFPGLALQLRAAAAAPDPAPATGWTLERGVAGLYNLDFVEAQQNFAGWQVADPGRCDGAG